MKKLLFLPLFSFFIFSNFSFASGICIVDAQDATVLRVVSSDVNVVVNDQIATVTMSAVFRNDLGYDAPIKFGFPMTETASALSLEWYSEGAWFTADFAPEPQDTILPGNGGGGGVAAHPEISSFLGDTPLYFDLENQVKADSFITFRLTYVDLLPYEFSKVSFQFPANYSGFQSNLIESQNFVFSLNSQRTIENIDLLTSDIETVQMSQYQAEVSLSLVNSFPDFDLLLEYQLNSDELGIFPFSTYLPDSAVTCDEHGRGYFAFIVEPDPSENTEVIDKVFTLIIDRSGSMSGGKMAQARDAASFVVNNLNLGDKFNLVAFDDQVVSFKPDHVEYNLTSQNEALEFIEGLSANGSTNISGAFSEAIADFANNNTEEYNIIVFFTDGEATAGITSTPGILDHVNNLISTYTVNNLSIFTFGIGTSVNQQLLTLLANNNQGLSEFLANADLQNTISEFYLTIQNPVLLYPEMTFSPPQIIETYPEDLPNLFKGQQMIVVGRYTEPLEVDVHFSGLAFGQLVEYDYTISLADTSVQGLQFLPRLWAKQKMADLFQDFFSYPSGSSEAMVLEDSIVRISICNGVISPFTSFEDNSGGPGVTETTERKHQIEDLEVALAPNPFIDKVTFVLKSERQFFETAFIEIFDLNGHLIKVLEIRLNGLSEYQVVWHGDDHLGNQIPSGVYYFNLQMGDGKIAGKLVKI